MAIGHYRVREETIFAGGTTRCENRNPAAYLANEGGGPLLFLGLPMQGGGESHGYEGTVETSFADGKVAEARVMAAEASGDKTSNWFYGAAGTGTALEDEHAFKNTRVDNSWATASGDVSVLGSVMTINDVGGGHNVHLPGEPLRAVSSGDQANSGFFVVVTSDVNDLVLETFGTPAAEVGVTFTITQEVLVDGSEKKSLGIEKHYPELGTFHFLPGQVVNGYSLAIPSSGFVAKAITFLGCPPLEDVVATAHTGPATSSNGDFAALDGQCTAKQVLINGVYDPSLFVDDTTITISYPNRGVPGFVGTYGPGTLDSGDMAAEVSLSMRFSNTDMLQRNLKGNKVSFTILMQDPNGNNVAVWLPSCAVLGGMGTLADISSNVSTSVTLTADSSANGILIGMYMATA